MTVDSHINERKQPSSILHFAFCIAIAKMGMHGWNQRDHGKGWPLLTFQTEALGNYGVQMKGVLSCLVHLARQASTRDFHPALAALGSSEEKKNSSPYTISIHV